MPVRGFLYFAEMYQKYLMKYKYRLFSTKLIMHPRPQYIVFYNGLENQPDRFELKMSDAFLPAMTSMEPCLECTALMLNINLGRNRELMEGCRKLKEYAMFVATVREKLTLDLPFNEAVDSAIQECIRNNVLKSLLIAHRAEVINMLFTDYDEQEHMACVKEEGFEEGLISGEEKFARLIQLLISNSRSGEIEKAINNKDYRNQLFNEFGL